MISLSINSLPFRCDLLSLVRWILIPLAFLLIVSIGYGQTIEDLNQEKKQCYVEPVFAFLDLEKKLTVHFFQLGIKRTVKYQ